MLVASCRAPKMLRKPDAPFWRNAAQYSRDARQRSPGGDAVLSCQPAGQVIARQLSLKAQGRTDQHVVVFAHERQPGTYQGYMVGCERLRTNVDVDGTIAAAPDLVR